jgi:hypothetical protein
VLDNDDLLGEILLRLAFPAALVRAALVCARWLFVASGAAFLRRFRGLHPPPLVGFYAVLPRCHRFAMTFVPMPNLPPELAAAARAAAATIDHRAAGRIRSARINDCRDGHLCVREFGTRGWVFYPLEPLSSPTSSGRRRSPSPRDRPTKTTT